MRKAVDFNSLTLCDHYVFKRVFADPANSELTRQVLQEVLGEKVGSLKHVQSEKEILPGPASRGMRLDIAVNDEHMLVDMEMQKHRSRNLPSRIRYYWAGMAQEGILLKPGQPYQQMPLIRIIFFNTFDFVGKGQLKYTFHLRCDQYPDFILDKGLCIIFIDLNAADHSVLGRLIQFFKNNRPYNRLTEELSKAISKAVHDPDFQEAYMTLQDLLDDYKEEYKEEGRVEGREEGRFELLQQLYLSSIRKGESQEKTLAWLKETLGLSDEEAGKLKRLPVNRTE